jgi:formylglycine-generating enzyme required for sulfatase activity
MTKSYAARIPLLLIAGTVGCVGSCSDGGGANPDASTDADVDTDTDTDTGTEPDLSWDGGPEIPCDGEPEEGEICIPGGTYLMGCMPYDTWCEDSEQPMVEVTLSPFYIEQYETTNGDVIEFLNSLTGEDYYKYEFMVCMGGGCSDVEAHALYNSGFPGSPDIGLIGEHDWMEPADGGVYAWGENDNPNKCEGKTELAAAGSLSWWGAKLFCEMKGKRLPTEAEWEAAARGRSKLIWPCAWYHLPCWYGWYACCDNTDECYGENCALCCLPFEEAEMTDCNSLYGVSGMYGNAAEWVLDGKDADHSWCADGCTDPAPRDGELHVLKGGAVYTGMEFTRISARKVLASNGGNKVTGVRCVRSPVSFDDLDAGPDGGK